MRNGGSAIAGNTRRSAISPSFLPPTNHCAVFLCLTPSFFFFWFSPRLERGRFRAATVRKQVGSSREGHGTGTRAYWGKSDEEKQKRSGLERTTGTTRLGALRAGAMFTQLPKRDRYVRVNFVIGKRERRNSAHPPGENWKSSENC